MKIVRFTIASILPVIISVCSALAVAQEQCEIISCDCTALPLDSWRLVCKERELKLKKQCQQKSSLVLPYCTAHGPQATNLPLALSLSELAVVSVKSIPPLNKKVAALYWAVHKDLQVIGDLAKNKNTDDVMNRIDVLNHNIDTLFEIQQQVTTSWVAYEELSESSRAWDDYAIDTQDMAEDLLNVGRQIWKASSQDRSELQSLKEQVSLALFRLAGKAYEHSAFAYGEVGKHDNAARTWRKAANSAEMVISVSGARKYYSEEVQFLKYQRAARLYRASYHWVKDEREDEAEDSLRKAEELIRGAISSDMG